MEDTTIDTSFIALKRGSILIDQSDGTFPPYAIVQASRRAYRDPRITLTVEQELKRALQRIEIRSIGIHEKHCVNCGDVKLKTEFDAHPETRDRLFSWCKSCRRAWQAKRKYEAREMERLQAIAQGTYRKPGRPSAA